MPPAVIHVLLALAGGERHGYAILKGVLRQTGSRIRFGPGTIYGTLQRLMEAGWMELAPAPAAADARRRYYRITRAGREALTEEVERLGAREMAQDFDEARGEASARGAAALWTLRCLFAIDLARTVSVQWLRTGLPVVALVSVLVSLAIAAALAAIARRATIPVPDAAADAVGILLLAVTSVVLIGMTITLSLWVSRMSPRRRR